MPTAEHDFYISVDVLSAPVVSFKDAILSIAYCGASKRLVPAFGPPKTWGERTPPVTYVYESARMAVQDRTRLRDVAPDVPDIRNALIATVRETRKLIRDGRPVRPSLQYWVQLASVNNWTECDGEPDVVAVGAVAVDAVAVDGDDASSDDASSDDASSDDTYDEHDRRMQLKSHKVWMEKCAKCLFKEECVWCYCAVCARRIEPNNPPHTDKCLKCKH